MASEPAAWTDLGSGVRLRRSRLYRMNSVVLEEPGHVAVVDPGILPSEIDDLAAATVSARSVTLIFTHGDWDHVLGRPRWPGAVTVGHDALAAELRHNRDAIGREADRVAGEAGEKYARPFEPFRPDEALSGLRATRLGSRHAVYRDAFGHSASMLSLHLPESRLLIAGDMLSDIEIPMLAESPQALAHYRRTLQELVPLAEHGAIATLVPGHGSPARGSEVRERIRRDLAYLETLAGVAARAAQAARKGAAGAAERAALEAVDLTPWRGDPGVDLDRIHQDNLRVALAASRAARPRA